MTANEIPRTRLQLIIGESDKSRGESPPTVAEDFSVDLNSYFEQTAELLENGDQATTPEAYNADWSFRLYKESERTEGPTPIELPVSIDFWQTTSAPDGEIGEIELICDVYSHGVYNTNTESWLEEGQVKNLYNHLEEYLDPSSGLPPVS